MAKSHSAANRRDELSGLQGDAGAGRVERLVYYVFDLLYLDGFDVRGAPLTERKRLLSRLIDESPREPRIHYVDHLAETNSARVLALGCEMNLKGIVSKRADAPYRSGRARPGSRPSASSASSSW